METFYRARAWFASGPSLLLFVFLVSLTVVTLPKPVKPPPRSPIRITIAPQQLPPTPLPAIPEVIQTSQPAPELVVPPATPRLAQRPSPRPTPNPAAAAPPQPDVPAAAAVAAEPPPVAARPAPTVAPDASYVAQIRTYLESIKRYPSGKEARLQRPRGEVIVWFVLDRRGGVKDSGIENSSGSLILDNAALQLVRGASYPAIPGEIYPDQQTHRFTVNLNYQLT